MNQTTTFFADPAQAAALAAKLSSDDPDTDYRVVEVTAGRFVVAIFEDGAQVFTL
jgi:hypothetical protein